MPGNQPSSQIIPSDMTADQVNRRLLRSLLDTLERRWLERFNINNYRLRPLPRDVAAGMLDEETAFIQVMEVTHSEDILQSLHLYNMQNVISSLRDGQHALVYVVRSDGQNIRLMLGVRRCSGGQPATPTCDYVQVLHRALRGNYPGLLLSRDPSQAYQLVTHSQIEADLLAPLKTDRYLAAITGNPSLRNPASPHEFFSQSIDRLVDALRGQVYTLMILSEPISEDRVAYIIQKLRSLSGEVHNLVNQNLTISRSLGESHSKTVSDTTTATLGVGQLLSAIFGISYGISTGSSATDGESDTRGASLSRETIDKTAEFCEQLLDHYIDRLQTGRSLGFWNVGVFLSSSKADAFLQAQGIARSLYSGQDSHFEPIRTLDLDSHRGIREYLGRLRLPVLDKLRGSEQGNEGQLDHPLGIEFQAVGTPLGTDELSILVSFPGREVPGLKLKQVADFNLNPPPSTGAKIGQLLYRGEPLDTPIRIPTRTMTRHTFITGLTGSGKTNTCLALLEDAYRANKLNFLVVDPAKTEYRFLLNSPILGKDLLLFTLGDEQTSPFRLNPFEFVRGFPLLGHIDLIKAVFNAAFPMYASMPYLLEKAILEIYRERGWNVSTSQNRYLPDINDPQVDYTPYLPRLSDLYSKIDAIVLSEKYDPKVTQDLTAALKARLGSLMAGGKGRMLDTPRSIPIRDLLERPVVLELRRAGDDDERSFIMALIFCLLYEACQNRKLSGKLQHVTLFEEAHRLLRNLPVSVSMESANPRGKTVEMFTDMMAEMRAHGEGFIIVDQMPSKLIPDVIKGSNLKIVHRLLAQDDRMAVGQAMGMTSSQMDYLSRLRVGEAVIHSEELEEPCLVMVDLVEDRLVDGGEQGFEPLELKRRCAVVFGERPTWLYQYPACQLCDAPCTYLSDDNQPTPALTRLGLQFLSAAALGTWNGCQQAGTELYGELKKTLPDGASAGQARCLRILLAAHTTKSLSAYYSSAWQGGLELQTLLAQAWENWPPTQQALKSLRQTLLQKIACNPPEPKAGCIHCPRRCWFGHFFQVQHPSAVSALKESFRRRQSGTTLSLQKLNDSLHGFFGDLLAQDFLPYAAYCLLVQSSEQESELKGLLQQIGGK